MKNHTKLLKAYLLAALRQPQMMAVIPHFAGEHFIFICAAHSGGMGDFYENRGISGQL
ncbi:MAG: hypothetical protein PUB32_06400 [Clostridiales bacterium]|nr:hypothetical protein [Clostridiales bacterium]